MGRTQKFLRRNTLVVLIMIAIIPIFQNCSGGFSSSGSSEAAGAGTNSANGGNLGGGAAGGGGVITGGGAVGGGTGGTGMTLAQVQAACKSLTRAPSLSAPSVTSVSVSSGLGSTSSGDQKTNTQISISTDRGVTDAAQFASLNCNAQLSLQLNCEVIANDTANPISMTGGYSAAGVNFLTTAPVKSQLNLAKDSFVGNACSVGFGVGASTQTFQVQPNTNTQRCSQGTFSIRLTLSSSVTGTNGNLTSAPQILRVNMNSGCWNETRLKDSAGDFSAVSNFGTAVAINGSWAAVVAPTEDAGAVVDVGAVYMYKMEGAAWVQKQKVMISDAAARDTISSVALLGSRMVIGSPYRGGQGMAYVFDAAGDTWTLSRQISPPTSQADQYFGQTVALTSTQVYVGAPNFNGGGLSKSGAVHIYSADGATFMSSVNGEAANIALGSALAADGSLLAAGAPQAIGREASAAGSVYVYSVSGGVATLAAKKTGTTNAETFGASVALMGNRLAVGSPNYMAGTNAAAGRVTFYDTYTNATAAQTYTGAAASVRMGQGVALSSTGIYIGIPYSNGRMGQVDHYLYGSLGTLYFRNLAYNGTNNAAYGWAVAASGSDVVIGARIKNDPNDNSGAAYIYRYK